MAFSADKAFDLIKRAHEDGRLAHAYLFAGAEGSGRRRLAGRIAALLNGGTPSDAQRLESPDVRVLRPESKSRRIRIANIRELESLLYLRGEPGQTRIGVIMEADRLTTEAQNAFLKTLEEPPDGCLLILITPNPRQLLETILSRCIRIDLMPEGSRQHGDEERALLEWLAGEAEIGGPGSLVRAFTLVRKFSGLLADLRNRVTEGCEAVKKDEVKTYGRRTEGTWLKDREQYYNGLIETRYLEQRERIIDVLASWFGDALRQKSGSRHLDLPEQAGATATLADSLTDKQLVEKLDAVEKLRGTLTRNVSEALALEVSFLKLFGS